MWIKKLYATFGKLDEKTLSLAPGLNIITGSNESGKSTWGAFICAMLFGISTREKSKAGYIADKEKFRPWSGKAMYGRMELSKNGEDIVIERTSGRGGVFSREDAKFAASDAPADTGEALVGVSKNVFTRTAFIGQARLAIDRDSDMEKRILSIASSGDESVSASEVLARLEKKQREIRSVRGLGLLPRLEQEEQLLNDSLADFEYTEERIKRETETLEASKKAAEKNARALKIKEAEETKKQREFSEKAREELSNLRAKCKEAEALPGKELLSDYDAKKAQLSEFSLEAKSLRVEYDRKQLEYEKTVAELRGLSAFAGMDTAVAEEMVEKDIERLGAPESKKSSPMLIALPILFGVLAVVFVILRILPAALAAATLAVSSALILIHISRKGKEQAELEKEKIEARYGSADTAVIEALLEKFKALNEIIVSAEKALESVRAQYERKESEKNLRENDIKELLVRAGYNIADIPAAEESFRRDVAAKERIMREYNDAEIRVETIEKTGGENKDIIEYSSDEIPSESSDELLRYAEELRIRIKNSELNLAALKERASGFDREKSEKRLSEMQEQKDKLNEEYSAYMLAMTTIKEADAEMKNRFSPEIEKRASEIFGEITNGSFEIVRIKNSDFELDVAANAASEPRNELFLSQGTMDELYLSLRLALCEKIVSESPAPPIILDDALVNFDEARMKKTLDYLKELAKNRQIILFTCHLRESEYFNGDASVNKIAL